MNWKTPTATGWSVRIAEDLSAVAIFDPAGVLRGELLPAEGDAFEAHFRSWKKESQIERYGPALRKGEPASLRLPDGSSVPVLDQIRHASRRRNKLCELTLAGRHYRLEHSSGRKAAALRDGVMLAKFTRARGLRSISVSRRSLAATTGIDELALTLFEKVILPGREGAFSEAMSALSG